MDPRLNIRYPRSWTETMKILQNLNNQLQRISKIKDKHRKAKDWIFLVHEINNFKKITEDKIIESKILLEEKKEKYELSKVIQEGLLLSFYVRTLRAIDEFMISKRIPKIK